MLNILVNVLLNYTLNRELSTGNALAVLKDATLATKGFAFPASTDTTSTMANVSENVAMKRP